MKKTLSVLFSTVLVLSMLFSVMAVPASAANTTTLTVTDTAGELGDIVEVSISVSADSYLVNGDLDLSYDPSMLRYVSDSCQASTLLDGVYWAANSPVEGEVRMSFASDASVGITAQGALFTMQFEIINKDAMQTSLSLEVSPLRGCNGGDDFDVKPTVTGGLIGIVGGADPWNLLQEVFLESGHENVSIDENGIWTVTGDFTLSPDFTMSYNDWQYIVQKFTTNTPVKITLVDNDPLGVYGKHEIGLYDNFVGPQYYPANSYDQVNSILGIYNWNITHAGWKNTGLATIDQVIVHFEKSTGVSAKFTSLYMSQNPNTTSSMVRTTATKPVTTTTTKMYNATFTVETVAMVGSIVTGDTVELEITASEIDAVNLLFISVQCDFGCLWPTEVQVADGFSSTVTLMDDCFVIQCRADTDVAIADGTCVATVTFTALDDITSDQAVTITDVYTERTVPGKITWSAVDGGITIVDAVKGDVTGDGDVNAIDAATLFYYINRLEDIEEALLDNADMNGDGKINLTDAARLFYTVNGLV